MALVKYAHVKIDKVANSLEEVVNDLGGEQKQRAMVRVAALLPVARCLDDYIYLRSWAVSAGEVYGCNDNLDYFPKDELLKSYATFINTGFYKDHANYNVKLAYGINLDAVYTPKDFVAVISAIKKAGLQPDQEWLVEQIKLGKVDQVSMGCQVETSTCSGCGNQATNVGEYCDCLQNARMMRAASVNGGMCPECKTANCMHAKKAAALGIVINAKSSSIHGKPLYEINRGCTFFDLSAITTVAADRNARIAEVIDKQASANGTALQDFIRPSVKVACVKSENGRCSETTCVCPTGGNQMGANLKREADVKKQAAPMPSYTVDKAEDVGGTGEAQHMTNAGDYPQKDGRPEQLMVERDKKSSPASKKEHEIRDRAQHDAGDYGAEKNPEELENHDSHDMHGKGAGAVSEGEVNKYRADAAKGAKGLGKEASADDGFLSELKGFFRGLMNKKAADEKAAEEAEPVKPVEMDEKGLDEVRASLRDDLESLQEASDKLHDETLKLETKASTAALATIQKRAQAEIAAYRNLDGRITEARSMVEGALAETKVYLEAAAKRGGVGKETVAALKDAAAEVRAEVDVVLDAVVVAVAHKMAGPAPMISPGTEGGPKPEGFGDVGPGAAYKLDMQCPVHARSGDMKCPPECPHSKAMGGGMGAPGKAPMPAMAKKADGNAEKNIGGTTEAQHMTDAGDYDRTGGSPQDKQDKKNVSQAKATQTEIDKQKDHSAQGQPEDWIAYRKMNALLKQFVAQGHTLKEAKQMAKSQMEKAASEKTRKEAISKIADELGSEDLKAQLVDKVSDKLVDAIFESDPSSATAQAAAEEVKSGDGATGEPTSAGEVLSPDLKPTSVAKRAAVTKKADDEGSVKYPGDAAISGDSPEEPSNPYWDLFPEDNISSTVSEANREMTSRSKETMREVSAAVSAEQPLFSNNEAYVKQASEAGDSLMGSDSLGRMLEAISLASSEVDAGIVDEAQLEEEAKRLFATPPEALKATSAMLAKVAKRTFKSPVPDGYLKQAISLGEGGGSKSEDFSLFENDDTQLF